MGILLMVNEPPHQVLAKIITYSGNVFNEHVTQYSINDLFELPSASYRPTVIATTTSDQVYATLIQQIWKVKSEFDKGNNKPFLTCFVPEQAFPRLQQELAKLNVELLPGDFFAEEIDRVRGFTIDAELSGEAYEVVLLPSSFARQSHLDQIVVEEAMIGDNENGYTKSATRLLAFIRIHLYLFVGVVIFVACLLLFIARESGIALGIGGIAIVIFGLMDLLNNTARRQPQLREVPRSNLSRSVAGLADGLRALIEAINVNVPKDEREKLILWRVLPSEITLAMTGDKHGDTSNLIRQYQEVASQVVLGGESEVNYWDETIVGHIVGGGKIAEYNAETWNVVGRIYFGEQKPDTTYLGIASDINEWIIIVSTSSVRGPEPDDYICVLVLKSDLSGDLRTPTHGSFSTERNVIVEYINSFKILREKLRQEGRYWYIDYLSEIDRQQVGEIVKKFILDGELGAYKLVE